MKKFLKKIPLIRWFLDIRRELAMIRFELSKQTRIQQQLFREIVSKSSANLGKEFPSAFEHQTYSQNGEDGVIQEIFRRVGLSHGTFVEIGTGDGFENNTRLLLELGWKGVWVEGDETSCETARKNLAKFIDSGQLSIINSFVTPENVNRVLKDKHVSKDVDLLSLDIDMHTHHVWEKLEYLNAKFAVVEYNGFFPRSAHWKSKYVEGEAWDGTINMGASLEELTDIGSRKDFRLIGCELTGTNAFFASRVLAEKYFPDLEDTNNLHEPSRHFLLNDPEHQK
jgi:hypothetical protein